MTDWWVVLGAWMRKPKLLSNLWKLNSSASILDNVAMRNDCSLEPTLPFTAHPPCPMGSAVCPKGTAQAKYGTENNSSLEMRGRPVNRAQCSNHKHKLMVCLLAMQRRCHEFESQRNGQQHLSVSSWMFKEPLASYSFQTQSHLFGEK